MLLALTLASCSDDYNDWAAPQTNPKEEAITISGFSAAAVPVIDLGTVSGDDCFIGPNVSIYTACHPTDSIERNTRKEWARPVTIGNNCWIGGSVTILPGVSIGDNVTIGAGSVVVKDIPSGCVAVGNPAKVIRKI